MSSTGVPRSGIFESFRQPVGVSRCLTVVLITLHLLLELRAQAQDWARWDLPRFRNSPVSRISSEECARHRQGGAVRFLKQADGALIRILLTPYGGMWKWNREMLIWGEVITGSDLLEGVWPICNSIPRICQSGTRSQAMLIAYLITTVRPYGRNIVCPVDCFGPKMQDEVGRPDRKLDTVDGSVDTNFWTAPSGKVARRLIIDPKTPGQDVPGLNTYDYSERRYTGYVYRSLDAGAIGIRFCKIRSADWKELEYDQRAESCMPLAPRSTVRSISGSHWTRLITAVCLPRRRFREWNCR